MGGGAQLIEIFVFAVLAGFLIHRLWNVLGRHNEEDRHAPTRRPRHDRGAQQQGPRPVPTTLENETSAIDPKEREKEIAAILADGPYQSDEIGLQKTIEKIKVVDEYFVEARFVDGAKVAFKMIVEAFAKGDSDALRNLLSDGLFQTFNAEIERRADEGQESVSEIRGIDDAEIVEASLAGSAVHLSVRFVSQQILMTKDEQGRIVEGDPHDPVELIDIWTFARNIHSENPNWDLVETRNAD